MEEETGLITESEEKTGRDEVFTKVVRAGKRTYFFDVKTTRSNDFYLTITESKKHSGKEGKIFYEKHKIFLYKEDFEKFINGLNEVIYYINNSKSKKEELSVEVEDKDPEPVTRELSDRKFTSVDFEDLGNI
ncbi:MAG TPA: DUF3276 family protein [Bacteroidales bacterium]|nr:DUF3276 family protein [Bacteroidales bacterium]HCI56436.1 DNA-binding protein [Bacteroidales bacterium]HOU95614.1 DUF3276 family protein [Bacteroidales bacterium]HQG36611.1 DUF3276 family protein [Bacteroidales bacterium]HQG53217.1 DUF3276 family protein [Bacteroidales bacterium]